MALGKDGARPQQARCAVIFAALCIFVLLVVLMFRRLCAARYSRKEAALLVALAGLQLGAAFSTAAFHALALALALYVAAEAAARFVRVQTAHDIITLGFLLAAIQIVSPAGLVMTAIIVPALALFFGDAGSHRKSTGLLVLLLFIPGITALILFYLAREFHFDATAYVGGSLDRAFLPQTFDRANPRRNGLIDAAVMAAVAFPVWLMAARSRASAMIAIFASALIAAVIVAALMRRSYPVSAFLPSMAGLSILAFAEFNSQERRSKRAIAIASTSVFISCLCLAASV